MIHKKVRFKGEEYWLHGKEFERDNIYLSPLSHFDENGELLANPFRDVSFAVIEDNDIVRYGDKIGELKDLEDVI